MAAKFFGSQYNSNVGYCDFDFHSVIYTAGDKNILYSLVRKIISVSLVSLDNETCVVYSNDGSAQSGVGNYVVQSLTINGIKRSLPTASVFTETRETLSDLIQNTLDILSASCNHKYSSKEILEKITFIMTDSTAHNIGVMEKVCLWRFQKLLSYFLSL